MSNFGAILTNTGAAKLANAIALGVPLKLTQMGVGDGNGQPVAPDPAMTAIPGERRRAAINTLFADPLAASQLVAEQIIPEDVGGWWIRCVGLYDDSNTLIAIANVPDTYKPLLTSGAGRTQIIRMVLIVSDTSAVELKIDPSVVLATRAFVDARLQEESNKARLKQSVKAATTGNVELSGLVELDGIALQEGDRVLVKNQQAARDNGIYIAAAAAWKRAADADTSSEVMPGMLVTVDRGSRNADSIWQLLTDAPITVGTTALNFELVKGKTGVAAGTYKCVTVDELGRVTAGDNPTTLDALGIDIPLLQATIYPEINGPSGNRLSVTASAGQIIIDPSSAIIWRGTRRFDIAAYSAEARTFTTAANKTYHLRWRPMTGFALLDVSSAAYNPGALAETHSRFDSQLDDAIIATVVTSATNVPTVTCYDNMAIYTPKSLVDMFSNTRLVTTAASVLFLSAFTCRLARSYRGRVDWDLWFGANNNLPCQGHPRIEFDGNKIGHGTRIHPGYSSGGYVYTLNYSGQRIITLNRGDHTVSALFRNELAAAVVFNPGVADAATWEQSGSSLSVTAVEVM